MQINWESFVTYNYDARGIRLKFEDLCRQLFANENLSGNKQFKYLHADPNNHGLETEPIYDETNKRWIGFQAKFFDQDVRYEQIKHSVGKKLCQLFQMWMLKRCIILLSGIVRCDYLFSPFWIAWWKNVKSWR